MFRLLWIWCTPRGYVKKGMCMSCDFWLLVFLLYFVRLCYHRVPKIRTLILWSAAVLGCSIARGWIELMLVVMLVAAGLFLTFSGSFFYALCMCMICRYACVCIHLRWMCPRSRGVGFSHESIAMSLGARLCQRIVHTLVLNGLLFHYGCRRPNINQQKWWSADVFRLFYCSRLGSVNCAGHNALEMW
jgi:hypothetical protein